MDFQYYCQTEIQSILDHIVPIPQGFIMSEQYLSGLEQADFVNGFKKLREIIIDIYKDMQKNPSEYGLICTSLEIKGFGVSEIVGKSRGSVSWLIMLFYNLFMAGEVSDNVLVVDPADYKENTKIKWVGGSKVKNDIQIIKKLRDFGFLFEGIKGDKFDKQSEKYILSYPDDVKIIKVLKGYIMTVSGDYNPDSYATKKFNGKLIGLDYTLLMDPEFIPADQAFYEYKTYLEGNEKKFYEKFHTGLVENGYIYKSDYGYRMRYFKKDKDKNYTVECQSDDRKLFVGMKLKNMYKYSDFIHSLPEYIKKMFMRNTCRPECNFQGATPDNCRFRVSWDIDGVEYRKCSFEDVFVPPAYNPEDVDYYVKLLALDK